MSSRCRWKIAPASNPEVGIGSFPHTAYDGVVKKALFDDTFNPCSTIQQGGYNVTTSRVGMQALKKHWTHPSNTGSNYL